MSDLDPIRARLQADLSGLSASFERAKNVVRQSTAEMSRRWEDVGRSMQRTGRRLSVGLTAPLATLSLTSQRTFSEFESNLQTIVGLVGVAQGQVDEWRDALLALGPAVGRGPGELADAMFFITSAGQRGEAALEALESSARASASGLGVTRDVALAVVSAMNTWEDSGLSAASATDVLVKTIREGNLDAASLSGSLGRVLGTAKAAGAGFSDLGGAIAVMSRQGLNADESVTALNSVFTLLLNSGPQARDVLGGVGLSLAELRRQLREEGLLAVLQTLSSAFEGNVEQLAQFIPNQRALRAVLSITGQDAEKVAAIFGSVRDATGALDEAYAAIANTAEMRVARAHAKTQASAIRFGDVMKEVTVPATEALADALDDLTAQLEEMPESAQRTVASLVALAAATGPAMVAVGSLGIAFGKLRSSALVTSAFASLKDSVTFLRAGFGGAATAGEALKAAITGGTAVAGGGVIAFVALAGAVAGFLKASREAGRAIEESSEAIQRSDTFTAGWRDRIVALRAENEELFGRWKDRVDELRESGRTTAFAWVRAWRDVVTASAEAEERARATAEASEDAARRAAEAARASAIELGEEFDELRRSMMTPEEEYAATLDYLENLRGRLEEAGMAGAMLDEIISRAMADALDRFKSAAEGIKENADAIRDKMKGLIEDGKRLGQAYGIAGFEAAKGLGVAKGLEETADAAEETNRAVERLGYTFSSAFEDAILKSGKLKDIFKGLREDVARIFLHELVTEPLGSELANLAGGLFGRGGAEGSAYGNVFTRGQIKPFAAGGVLTGPVAFPLADGRTGLAGEAGHEAVMPLHRTNRGELGVRVSGDGASETHITVNFPVVVELRNASIDSRDAARFFAENESRIGQAVLRQVGHSRTFLQQFMRGGG